MEISTSEGRPPIPAAEKRVVGVPGILKSNSSTAARDNVVAYFSSVDGTLMLAPSTNISPQQCGLDPRRWRRFEAVGAREIERISVILARQEFEHKRKLKVNQAIRELEFLNQAEAGARIRRAMNYSKADVAANALQEKRWAARREAALSAIASEVNSSSGFDSQKRTVYLEMEVHEQSNSPLASVGRKKVGIQ